jgi:hypothetical protein
MTTPPTSVLEVTGYRAPLAVRGVDAVSGSEVADGLVAVAWPAGDPASARTARRSPVSVLLGFGTLPGLYAQEYATGDHDTEPVWPAPAPVPFVVTVADTAGRYLPVVLTVDAPRTQPLDATLYSAPARPRPGSWATVYGEVRASPGDAPCAWALIDVTTGGRTHHALADALGRFRCHLPYPEALPALAGIPPVGGGIGGITWPLTVSVYCEPTALHWSVDPALGGPPDLGSIQAQQQAQMRTGTGTGPSLSATLSFGTPLLLRLVVVPE